MNNKPVFFDIDNTLYDNSTHSVPSGLGKALKLLKDRGYPICIATGRAYKVIPEEILDAAEWDYYVCSNGQHVLDHDMKEYKKIFLPRRAVKECVCLAERTGTPIMVKTPDRSYMIGDNTDSVYRTYKFFGRDPWPAGVFEPDEDVLVCMVFRDTQNYEDFTEIEGISVYPAAQYYADINAPDCSKYTGIQCLLAETGYTDYIAFGDSGNDIEMLSNAAVSIAMGNGTEEVKKISTFTTDTAHNDGILKAVERLLNRNE